MTALMCSPFVAAVGFAVWRILTADRRHVDIPRPTTRRPLAEGEEFATGWGVQP